MSEITVNEGNYVSAGATLFRLASINALWVEAQVYLPYLTYLKIGTEASFLFLLQLKNCFRGK
ncbi:MAG: efflux RND transporter periplasmic adaptor subunit [Bacteroidetes bacterium]|nr:efflux RND transporter periplasmic adaptor subunit [Bacteroidota bacterium]